MDYTRAVHRGIDEALEQGSSRWRIALGPWSRALTMRAMCKLVLDVEDAATVRRFFQRFEATTTFSANIVSYSKSMWRPHGLFSVGTVAAYYVDRINQIVYRAIAERRLAGAEW